MGNLRKRVGEFWSNNAGQIHPRLRWWNSPHVVRHINELVCGESVDGLSEGLIRLVQANYSHLLPLHRGVSVGGGAGEKEMRLLQQGIVDSFEIYEYSEARIQKGRERAKRLALEGRVSFIHGDAFELVPGEEQYDLVHWNNALHHMFDVDGAVSWSRRVLKTGGLFYMDDFIGSSRFQWPREQLRIASFVREMFRGSKYLKNPKGGPFALPVTVRRPWKIRMKMTDPSEAADSERIVGAVRKYFPDAMIRPTGGVIYNLALNDMIANFDEDEQKDRALLSLLMSMDKLCAELGHSHYGVAVATKE